MAATRTIKEDTIRLLTRSRPMTYQAIVGEIKRRHPEAQTSEKTVAWYASRLRAEGRKDVNVKRANSAGTSGKGDKPSRR